MNSIGWIMLLALTLNARQVALFVLQSVNVEVFPDDWDPFVSATSNQ